MERIFFLPLTRLAQYQHCLLRRNGFRTAWGGNHRATPSLQEQLATLCQLWRGAMEEDRSEQP